MPEDFKRVRVECNFLNQFISEKLANYSEPQRKGVTRGNPIGLSKTKFHASLLMLTDVKLKEIARTFKLNEVVVRRWNTERIFKDMVKTNKAEFALFFREHLSVAQSIIDSMNQALLDGTIDKLPKSKLLKIGIKDKSVYYVPSFQDEASLYGNDLIKSILLCNLFFQERIQEEMKKAQKPLAKEYTDEALLSMAVLRAVQDIILEKEKDVKKRTKKMLEQNIQSRLLTWDAGFSKQAEALLSNQALSELDKNIIQYMIGSFELLKNLYRFFFGKDPISLEELKKDE